MSKFDSVFEAYPDATVLYVVDDMPFVDAVAAKAHSISTGKPVETVQRIKPAEAGTADTSTSTKTEKRRKP